MTMRGVYRLLLRLHPSAFRERFADEMLWIFDQMTSAERRALLGDGLASLARQWTSEDPAPRVSVPFGLVPVSSHRGAHVAQATAVAALLTMGFFKLLTQSVPLPKPPKTFEIRRAAWVLCHTHSHPLEKYPGGAPTCRAMQ